MVARFTRAGEVLVSDGTVAADINNPMDILGWLNDGLELEEGITFAEVARCLSPWVTAVSHMVHGDVEAIIARCSEPVPEDGILIREDFSAIEIIPFITVDRADGEPVATVSVEWEAFGRLRSAMDGVGRSSGLMGLSLRHPAEYAGLPVKLVTTAVVSDIMTGGDMEPYNMEPVVHPSADGSVRNFAVLPTVMDCIVYGLMSEVRSAGSDDLADRVSESVADVLDRYA
jgi:hypothetical protein